MLTIIFATFNGASTLPRLLDGYRRQRTNHQWRMIAVDNGSTDSTQELLVAAAGTLPITVLSEPKPGKNRALNLALPHAQGHSIMFSDDDVIPDPGLIDAWYRAAEVHPTHDLFGGTVEPVFDGQPPLWLASNRFKFAELFAARDLPDGEIDPVSIFGPNMMVRRRVFDAGLRFNEAIGPNASIADYPMGSETEFCRRAGQAGYRAMFVSEAKVQHIIRPHQVTNDFWRKRAYKHGLGVAKQQSEEQIARFRVRGLKGAVIDLVRNAGLSLTLRLHPSVYGRNTAYWEREWRRGFHDGLKSRMTPAS